MSYLRNCWTNYLSYEELLEDELELLEEELELLEELLLCGPPHAAKEATPKKIKV